MKEITLKSGAVLKIGATPFDVSKCLFQAVVKSLKNVEISKDVNSYEGFVAALIGAELSDSEVEKWIWACLSRCTYNNAGKADLKIESAMFEDDKAREDFIDVCIEVGQENLRPFMKGLYLALPHLTEMIENIQKPK